mmetsp:Transcript_16216/g.50776  ORF Transcript_16216/g.50776 Transcript_16216/m.50776 type:complete len:101 (+) Transcript_16216:2220-2522(+)
MALKCNKGGRTKENKDSVLLYRAKEASVRCNRTPLTERHHKVRLCNNWLKFRYCFVCKNVVAVPRSPFSATVARSRSIGRRNVYRGGAVFSKVLQQLAQL